MIYKRGQVWWIRLSFQKRQIRVSTGTKNKKLAERIHGKVRTQVEEGQWFNQAIGSHKTFKELMDRYLKEHSAPNKAPMSYRRDLSLADHLNRSFGTLTLSQIRPSLIAEHKGRRRIEGAAPRTINYELGLMHHAFKLAIKDWEWVTDNPVSKVSREPVHNLIERWLTKEEEERLLAACPQWLREIVVFAMYTGLRQSEILNLQWSAVNLFGKTITVTEQKNRDIDTLPVNESALEVLKARAKSRKVGVPFVFFTEVGTQRGQRNLIHAFCRACKKAKVDKFRFHDLRHTFATRLIQMGVDLYTVQKLGRWKTVSMVMRYAHHNPESLRPGVTQLDQGKKEISTNLAQSPGRRAEGHA